MNPTLILRVAMAAVLFAHSIPTLLNGTVNAFGSEYLNTIGFAPVGVPLAWAIKLSHVVCAVLLLLNRYVLWASVVTIAVLFMGIVLVHFQHGWFVVGGGTNGIEFNVVLISVLAYLALIRKRT
jgi:putative oxidoreductase